MTATPEPTTPEPATPEPATPEPAASSSTPQPPAAPAGDPLDRGDVLTSALDECVRRFGDEVALYEADRIEWTYRQLAERRDALAAGLAQSGVTEGSVVALTLDSGADYLCSYLAAARIGAITCGVNPALAESERAAILDHLQAEIVLDPDAIAGLPKATEPLGSLDSDPERPVTIVLTSGTTGLPKGAIFANHQLHAIVGYDGAAGVWGGAGHMLASTQFAHVGFMTKLPWYLATGGCLHVMERWRAEEALELVATHKIDTLGVVAPQIALMCGSDRLAGLDVSCVERIVAGGAASPPNLVDRACATFGADYSIRYSSTESGGVGTGTAWGADRIERTETVGRPREGLEVKIVDEDGTALGPGERGEVCLRSAAVMSGYWRNEADTARALRNGWLHTGDVGWFDPRGCLRLAGRNDDVYIRGGYNVHPGEVEAVLCSHEQVSEVGVAPRPDPVMGEIGVAVVVVADGVEPPTLESLREFGAERLAGFKLPEAVIVADALPLTPMAKLDRRALIELAAASDS